MFRAIVLVIICILSACNSSTPGTASPAQKPNTVNYQDTIPLYKNYIRNIDSIDLSDITSDWQWLLQNRFTPVIITNAGDIFLKDRQGSYYFLDTGIGKSSEGSLDSGANTYFD